MSGTPAKPKKKRTSKTPDTSPKGPGTRLRAATEPKGGGPGKPRRLSPDELDVLGKMAMVHMTTRDMAHILGMSESTLERMISDDPLVSKAVTKNRAEGQRIAHSWAFKKAFQGQGNVDMAKFWLRVKGGFTPPPVAVALTASDGVSAPRVEFVVRGGGSVQDALDEFLDDAQPDGAGMEEAG